MIVSDSISFVLSHSLLFHGGGAGGGGMVEPTVLTIDNVIVRETIAEDGEEGGVSHTVTERS